MAGNMMKLLTSYQLLDAGTPEQIVESRVQNGGKILLKGLIQRADALNQNGRVYARHILEREVRNYQKFVKENRALGELDHPDSSVINLQNVSHIMREVRMEGDAVYGSLELLDTPKGKIAQSLVESGVKLGISSRGVGSTHREGDVTVVEDDFVLLGWDIVSDPSTIGAFILPEGRVVGRAELNQALTKADRVNRLVNDILYRRP